MEGQGYRVVLINPSAEAPRILLQQDVMEAIFYLYLGHTVSYYGQPLGKSVFYHFQACMYCIS